MNRFAMFAPDDTPHGATVTLSMLVHLMSASGVELRTLCATEFEANAHIIADTYEAPNCVAEQQRKHKRSDLIKVAQMYVPQIGEHSDPGKAVHAAVVALICGDDAKTPVDLLVGYWSTGSALQQFMFALAVDYGTHVVNLAHGDAALWQAVEALK